MKIVVLGGGPAGLVFALHQRRRHGLTNEVVVLEAHDEAYRSNPNRAFSFNLNERSLPGLEEAGVSLDVLKAGGGFEAPGMRRQLNASGSSETRDNSIWLGSLWISRPRFLELLSAQAQVAGIDVRRGRRVAGIEVVRDKDGNRAQLLVRVESADTAAHEESLHCDLLVGTDGWRSPTRQFLQELCPDGGFDPVELPMLSTGYQYKSLRVRLPGTAAGEHVALPSTISALSMACFPQALHTDPRTGLPSQLLVGNTRHMDKRRRNDILFDPTANPEDVFAFLAKYWPQVDWRQSMSDDEMREFIETPPSVFPPNQYTRRRVFHAHPDGVSDFPVVVLAGDAARCSPPDHGQGVNCALQDVHELARAGPEFSREALRRYEVARVAEGKSLCELGVFFAPWQYSAGTKPLAYYAWLGELLGVMFLSKLGVTDKPAQFRIFSAEKSFADLVALRKRNRNVLFLVSSALLVSAIAGIGGLRWRGDTTR